MSYSIIRVQKMNGQAIKGIQFHNQREKGSQTNPDIREADHHLNYDLIHGSKKLDYKKEIDKVISENVKSEKKIRKDAVLVSEFLITSDTDFFDKLSPEDQKRYFETAKDFIADRYGQQNVIYATVHNDEKTPHMHVGIVPVTEDGRLSAKEVIGNRMQLVKLQDAFNAHVNTHGFDLERGLSRSGRKHLDMPKFKQTTTYAAEKEAIEKHEQTLSKIKAIDEKTKAIEDLPEPTKVMGRVMLKNDDYETLVNYASTGAEAKVEVVDLQRKLTEKEKEIVQLKTEMKEGQEELRKNYFGIEYRNGEIRSNLEDLAIERANQRVDDFLQEREIVKEYNDAVDKYNAKNEDYKKLETLHLAAKKEIQQLEFAQKSSNREEAILNATISEKETEIVSLQKEHNSLRNEIKDLTNELSAWKERAVLAFHQQFKRIKSFLNVRGVEPEKLKSLDAVEDRMVAASIKEIEKPKQPQKTMEMEM